MRNKRRHDPDFRFPEEVQTREEIQQYLDLCKYRKQEDVERELKDEEEE